MTRAMLFFGMFEKNAVISAWLQSLPLQLQAPIGMKSKLTE